MVKITALVAVLLLLGGCASVSPPTPAPIVNEAPWPKEYTCAEQTKAATEMARLPNSSVLLVWLDDYRVERRALRVAHKQDPDAKCR